jgi:hypothetical protein
MPQEVDVRDGEPEYLTLAHAETGAGVHGGLVVRWQPGADRLDPVGFSRDDPADGDLRALHRPGLAGFAGIIRSSTAALRHVERVFRISPTYPVTARTAEGRR